jgi:hypothetical protein
MFKKRLKKNVINLMAAATIFQPAMASEVVVRCEGTSTMTIYNPHGDGGSIGGPTDKTWVIKLTDGKKVSIDFESEEGSEAWETSNIQLGVTGLSYCTSDEKIYQCGVAAFERGPDGFMRKILVSPTTISPGGEYYKYFSNMTTDAAMRTGLEIVDSGQCDRLGMAALMRVASGKEPFETTVEEGND